MKQTCGWRESALIECFIEWGRVDEQSISTPSGVSAELEAPPEDDAPLGDETPWEGVLLWWWSVWYLVLPLGARGDDCGEILEIEIPDAEDLR